MKILFLTAVCAQLVGAAAAVVPGHVEAWGTSSFGAATAPPGGLSDLVAIAAGLSHNLALRSNGTVVAWGYNAQGQTDVPPGLSNVVAISARLHSVALKADGTVVCWGSHSPDVLNVPSGLNDVVAIAAGGWGDGNAFTLALRASGTVAAWGAVAEDVPVPAGLNQVVQVAGGGVHSLAVRSDGTVVGWGRPNLGNPEVPPPGLANVILARGGQSTSFVIKQDHTLFKWGGSFDSNDIPAGVAGIADVQLGNQHVLALRTNGTVLAWGSNFDGEGSVPPGLTGVQAIAAGAGHNLVLTARPLIRAITAPLTAGVGEIVTLSVDAGGEALAYQWQHAGTNLPGQTNATLAFRTEFARAGSYSVVVGNPHGFGTASTAVSFNLPPPEIRLDASELVLYRGENTVIRASVTGIAPFRYQWRKNGAPISGATGPDLEIVVSDRSATGEYRVMVTDAASNSSTSFSAIVTGIDPREGEVRSRPVLDTSIHSQGINALGNATLLAGTRRRGGVDRALLRFDLSGIPPWAVVAGSELRLTVVKEPGAPADSKFELQRLLKHWTAAATWKSASAELDWSVPGGAAGNDYLAQGSSAPLTPDDQLVFEGLAPMIADLQGWIADPATNHGWMLISDSETTGSTARHFGSSESAQPPELIVRYSLPAAPPRISARVLDGQELELSFSGSPGWFYEIQARDDLAADPWVAVTNVPAGAARAPLQARLPLTQAHRFYRARAN